MTFLTFFSHFSLPFLRCSFSFFSSDGMSTKELISPTANNQPSNHNNPVASSDLITDPFIPDEENALSSSNRNPDTVNALHHI
jgi:hypothetical protein